MFLLKTFTPIILVVGFIGNLLSFYVFTRPGIRDFSVFRILAYLSIVDFFYLIVGCSHLIGISYFDYDFRNYSDLVCAFHSFLTLFLSHSSSNILALVSVHRCVTLTQMKPRNLNRNNHLHNSINTNRGEVDAKNYIVSHTTSSFKKFLSLFKTADLIVLGVISLIFIFDSHFLFLMRLGSTKMSVTLSDDSNITEITVIEGPLVCYPSSEDKRFYYEFYTKMWPLFDLFVYSYIPFLIMIICTIIIIYHFVKIKRKLKKHFVKGTKLTNRRPKKTNTNNNNNNNANESDIGDRRFRMTSFLVSVSNFKNKKRQKNEMIQRVTRRNNQTFKLLLSINIIFFILVTPIVTCNSLGLLTEQSTSSTTLEIVYILAYLNHCLNFFLYGMSCKTFRDALVKSICWK
jgi:hypothetical protein